MKATLTFTLPEEREEHLTAVQAQQWRALAWELDNFLRGELKHNPELSDSAASALQGVRDLLHEQLADRGLSFDV